MATIAALVRAGVERLTAAGSTSPRLDAELLLGHALGIDRTGVLAHGDGPVGDAAAATYEAALARREAGEPVAYIRGLREFHGLAFAVDARALIPRPETELLVDLAEAAITARLAAAARPPGTPPLRVADVGTGSGAIAVALAVALRRRRMADDVEVSAIDISDEALGVAKENAVGHGVADRLDFVVADLLPEVPGRPFDVLCANLPYIRTTDLDGLGPEVASEPRLALDGGADGLAVIRRLVARLPGALARDGVALLEIGAEQGSAVASLVDESLPGWGCEVLPDLAGHDRVVRLTPPGAATAAPGAA